MSRYLINVRVPADVAEDLARRMPAWLPEGQPIPTGCRDLDLGVVYEMVRHAKEQAGANLSPHPLSLAASYRRMHEALSQLVAQHTDDGFPL